MVTVRQVGPISVTGDGPLVVREKTHAATPMTLDQALYEMELVGQPTCSSTRRTTVPTVPPPRPATTA